jgi:hypothetical protein
MTLKIKFEQDSFTAGNERFNMFKRQILEPNRFDFVCGFTDGAKWYKDKQDDFTLGFLHWYNTSQECETYLRRNYPKNITMNGEHYKKVLEINKELLEMYKNTLPR